MKPEKLAQLSMEQQWAMIIAYGVRDALEPFHVGEHRILPPTVMPELNRRVRYAVLQSVYALLHLDRPNCRRTIARAARAVPDYWEIVELLPEERAVLDADEESEQRYHERERVHPKRQTWLQTGRYDDTESPRG